jgi:hypothetical protein
MISAVQKAGFAIHPVKSSDTRYRQVRDEVLKTANGSWTIKGIWIVRNDQAAAGGSANRRRDWEQARKRVGGSTLWLFHGTPTANLQSILASTLRPSSSGAYGPGIYMSPNSNTASGYAFKTGRPGFLLSCRVVLGKQQRNTGGSISMGYDSLSTGGTPTSTDKHASNIYLIRSDRQVYLRFITQIG